MPIRPEMKPLYGTDWPAISLAVKVRAGWRCEWCPAVHGKPAPISGKPVVITVAHLNHQPGDNRPENLRALCQRCHLTYDQEQHAATRSARRA